MVLHDLNLAARYAERLVAMKDGGIVAAGTPAEVLTEQLLRRRCSTWRPGWCPTRSPGRRWWCRCAGRRSESAVADTP